MPPAMPGRPPYEQDVVKKWTAQTAASDGFVFVTPEYNYGTSAVLKNAIDWVYPEWNRKAAAFVSYGSAMGARAVQQLRETANRDSNGADSVICPHSRCDIVGTFSGRGRRQGPRRTGKASQRHDRRPGGRQLSRRPANDNGHTMKTSTKTHEGRVALVTGAAQGIGQRIALALAQRGAQVIATDLALPNETVAKIGPSAYGFQLDVTHEEN